MQVVRVPAARNKNGVHLRNDGNEASHLPPAAGFFNYHCTTTSKVAASLRRRPPPPLPALGIFELLVTTGGRILLSIETTKRKLVLLLRFDS